MELNDFLHELQNEINLELGTKLAEGDSAYPYKESIFAEVVMRHMAEAGMTFGDPQICRLERKIGNATLRLSGYAISDDGDQMDFFVSLYGGYSEVNAISDTETKQAAERCFRFIKGCVDGRLEDQLDPSDDAYPLVLTVKHTFPTLDQIRVYVITDGQAKSKNFKTREQEGKDIRLEVMDIERLFRHTSAGKPRDELAVDMVQLCGTPLPCVFVKGVGIEYDYAMAAIPGEALRYIYERYGGRLLEANVRSFLSVTGKVNRGIRDTLKNSPERFMAYNNGIVIVTDEMVLGRAEDGSPGIAWLKGLQIVNGGQTTASLYFTKKRDADIDLTKVRIPAKIIVLHRSDPDAEEALISDISRFANSQNAVKLSDLSANKPFHVALEQLSLSTFCPDGIGRWFYERAAGSYSTMLAREGSTPAKLRQLKEAIPSSRRITKTDLAKYIQAWDRHPDSVSRGSQKNFDAFMTSVTAVEQGKHLLPDIHDYKRMIAKAIIYKSCTTIVRPVFKAFQANVVAYLVSVLAEKLGDRIDLERIWERQTISDALRHLLNAWAETVNERLFESASGRMVSEWAKKPDAWLYVREGNYPLPPSPIPELR